MNSLLTLDDGKRELAVVTDVSMGGASMVDGQLELMVHRRVLVDDHRGVQEPLNETMCGCNDINANPGAMGAHGHEADGGCECAGLTMRGVAYIVVDNIAPAHAIRRKLVEQLNFPPTLAFASSAAGMAPTFSAVGAALPENVKLMTLTNNYAETHGGMLLMRIAHMYQVDEHPTLAQPVEVDFSKVCPSFFHFCWLVFVCLSFVLVLCTGRAREVRSSGGQRAACTLLHQQGS